jgi:hypothetical protein
MKTITDLVLLTATSRSDAAANGALMNSGNSGNSGSSSNGGGGGGCHMLPPL